MFAEHQNRKAGEEPRPEGPPSNPYHGPMWSAPTEAGPPRATGFTSGAMRVKQTPHAHRTRRNRRHTPAILPIPPEHRPSAPYGRHHGFRSASPTRCHKGSGLARRLKPAFPGKCGPPLTRRQARLVPRNFPWEASKRKRLRLSRILRHRTRRALSPPHRPSRAWDPSFCRFARRRNGQCRTTKASCTPGGLCTRAHWSCLELVGGIEPPTYALRVLSRPDRAP